MVERIAIIGAGGFGREALDVIEAHNARSAEPFEVFGVIDDAPSALTLERLATRGYRYLGSIDNALSDLEPAQYVVGIGDPTVRRTIAEKMDEGGWEAATVIHPSASLGSARSIAEGTVICGGVQLSTSTSIGRHVHLNPGAIVGHDTVLESYVSINPGAVVSGDVIVREGVLVGAGAVILQGLTVGAGVVVGASACVVRDVRQKTTVKGVPAR